MVGLSRCGDDKLIQIEVNDESSPGCGRIDGGGAGGGGCIAGVGGDDDGLCEKMCILGNQPSLILLVLL